MSVRARAPVIKKKMRAPFLRLEKEVMVLLPAAKNEFTGNYQKLEEENIRLKKLLEERKLIERAKGILMKREGLSEDEAYKRIQKLSMNKRKKMVEIAEAIIIVEEAKK